MSILNRHENTDGFVWRRAPPTWSTGTGAAFAIVDVETGEREGPRGLVRIELSFGE